jgi:hypothetical protein
MTPIRPRAGLYIPARSILASLGALALASAAVVTLGASEPSVASAWRTQPIAIDGSSDAWPAFSTLSDEPPLSMAAANDGQFLYLAIRTSDPGARMMIERQGLVVWLDAKGKKDKRFGLHYPESAEMPALGEGRSGRRGGYGGGGGGYGGGGGGYGGRGGNAGGQPPQEGERQGPPADPQTDGRWRHMEIIGPAKDDKRDLMLDHVPGIEVKVGDHEGVLTYELRVPLQVDGDDPYAIGVQPGAVIGLGLETPKIEMPRRPGGFGGGFGGRGGGEMGGGGMGGGRRGGYGGEGGERGQFGGRMRMKPLKLWATVTLASAAPAQ